MAQDQPKPKAAPEAVPDQTPAQPATPSASGSPRGRDPDPRTPGEAYTPRPDFSEPRSRGWRYLAAAAILALALTVGYLKLHPRVPASAPAAPQAVEATGE
jgi:hypothetical protein